MIVRINQFDPANAEPYSGWGDDGLRGAIHFDWPDDAHGFEVLILESDERQRELAPTFRQSELRRLLPEIVNAVIEPGEEIVARLDGPVATGELAGVVGYLTEADGTGRFACSAAGKFDAAAVPPIASVRIHLTPPRLAALCNDASVGLDSGVRLRIFLVAEPLVNAVLHLNNLDDERWCDVLPQAGAVIGTMRTMQSIYLLTRRMDSTVVRQRIMERLLRGVESRMEDRG